MRPRRIEVRRPNHVTVDLDAIAYAEVGLEIARQCQEQNIAPKYLYLAALDTTQAGLALSLAYLESPIKVRGFCPVPGQDDRHQDMANLANQAARRLGLDIELKPADFDNDDTFIGEGYGIPSPEGLNALRTQTQAGPAAQAGAPSDEQGERSFTVIDGGRRTRGRQRRGGSSGSSGAGFMDRMEERWRRRREENGGF